MASKKRQKRPSAEYLKSAKFLAKFVPSLKKYRRRKTLRPQEKSAIARREKQLRFVANKLQPVTAKQAKAWKKDLYMGGKGGIKAIEMGGVGPGAKFKKSAKEKILISNNRTWLLWSLDRQTVQSGSKMSQAGRDAFNMQFPIERVAELAKIAFKRLKVLQINLWAAAGIVGQGFTDLGSFLDWVAERWQGNQYVTDKGYSSNPERWINGIAILINERGK